MGFSHGFGSFLIYCSTRTEYMFLEKFQNCCSLLVFNTQRVSNFSYVLVAMVTSFYMCVSIITRQIVRSSV